MFVTTIPFTTATLAANLRGDIGDVRVAVLLYGVSMEGMSISYRAILHRMVYRNLLVHPVDERTGRRAINRFGLGTLLYPVVTVIGLFSPVAMLALYAGLTGFYITEQTAILPSAADDEAGADQVRADPD